MIKSSNFIYTAIKICAAFVFIIIIYSIISISIDQRDFSQSNKIRVNQLEDNSCKIGFPGFKVSYLNYPQNECTKKSIIRIQFKYDYQSDEYDNPHHFFRETIMPMNTWLTSCSYPKEKILCEYVYTSNQVFENQATKSILQNAVWDKFCLSVDSYNAKLHFSSRWLQPLYTMVNILLSQNQFYCLVEVNKYHLIGAKEREVIGASETLLRKSFSTLISSVKSYSLLKNYQLNLNYSYLTSTRRRIVIYDRQDNTQGCALLNSREVLNKLTHQLSDRYDIQLIHSLPHSNKDELYYLFSTTSVFIAPSGGWMPNVLMMTHDSLVIIIGYAGGGRYSWDGFFQFSDNLKIAQLLDQNEIIDPTSSYQIFTSVTSVPGNKRRDDFEIGDVQNISKFIASHIL